MGTSKRHYSDDFHIFLFFMELIYCPKAIDRLLCNGWLFDHWPETKE